jgi:hypothetical protein
MKWGIGGIVLVVLSAGAWITLDPAHECGRHQRFRSIAWNRGFCRSAERPSSFSLKTLTSAQADFRANDRDGDGVKQFWRADVAGLYALAPGGGPAIKLIELSLAAADDRPVVDLSAYAVRSQKAGYWYRAIHHADEDPKALDPNRFAYCAFPDSVSAGKYIFIVDENNTIFRTAANGRRGVDLFPPTEELEQLWTKID